MSRPSKGARLYLRKRRGRESVYVIRDTGGIEVGTGTSDRREAEKALGLYIAERDLRSGGPYSPGEMSVSEVLAIYGREHAPSVADPARIGYAIDALVSFWGDLPVDEISGATCRRYVVERGVAQSTARRELGTLSTALRYCEAEGYLTRAPRVTLPPKGAPKDNWLTEAEAAAFLRAARHTPHLARFILLGLYTGTRKGALLRLSWLPQTGGGWIDLDAGVLYRRGSADRETRKRQPAAKLPSKLLAHCRRWQRDGSPWVIHHRGARVASVRTAWDNARRASGIDITPHTLRHTAITWAMQRGVRLADASGFFGVSIAELERTYLHHHPDFQADAAAAMNRVSGAKLGRGETG